MAQHYSSFLVRCWRETDGAQRVIVEHIQSGERVAVPHPEVILGWLTAWVGSPLGVRGENAVPGAAPHGVLGTDLPRRAVHPPLPPRPPGQQEEPTAYDEWDARRGS